RKEADDERAGDVDDESAPGKRLAESARDHARAPEARGGADRAAQHDPEIAGNLIHGSSTCDRHMGSPNFSIAPNPKFAHTVPRVRLRTSGSKGALESYAC